MKAISIITTIFFTLFSLQILAQDWPNLAKFQEANQKLLNQKNNGNRIVFMGNSITEGWLGNDNDFFPRNGFINRGISGQTTPQMLVRFRQDVIDLEPKIVIILAGINDIAGNTGPSTINMIADNLKSMAELADQHNIKVIISSTLPAFDFPWSPGMKPAEKVMELNSIMEVYCKKNNHIYLDYWTEMKDDRNGLPTKYSYDEVHTTAEGYAVMERLVMEAIAKAK